jgi:hypothetical protein
MTVKKYAEYSCDYCSKSITIFDDGVEGLCRKGWISLQRLDIAIPSLNSHRLLKDCKEFEVEKHHFCSKDCFRGYVEKMFVDSLSPMPESLREENRLFK